MRDIALTKTTSQTHMLSEDRQTNTNTDRQKEQSKQSIKRTNHIPADKANVLTVVLGKITIVRHAQ